MNLGVQVISQGHSKTTDKKILKEKSIIIVLENRTKEKDAVDEAPVLRNFRKIILGYTIESISI